MEANWREHQAIWRCDNKTYHADRTHISSTALSCFSESRVLYHARYIAGTLPFPAPTEAMALGTALHARLLEPQTWEKTVAIAPHVDRRTKDGKAAWQAFLDSSPGKTIISADQADTVQRMVDGVAANPFASRLLSVGGESEIAVRWVLDGVPVKVRFDRCLDAEVIVDIKTTSDPSPDAFSRSVYSFGYYKSAWLYQQAAKVLGMRQPEFLHLAIGTVEPWEAIVYEIDDRALDLGEQHVRRALAELKSCRESGNWASPMTGKINPLSLPRYAFMS